MSLYCCEVSQHVAIETVCETMPSRISQIKNRSGVQLNAVPGKRFSPLHRGRKLLSPCKPASALPDDCLLSGFHVLKIIMHNAFCLSQAEIFPLIGLSPPSRALWDGEYFASRGSRSCFLRLRSTKGLSGMGVFKSASVILVSSYSQVKIPLYSLDFLR